MITRLLLIVATAAIVLTFDVPFARACGEWSLNDVAQDQKVTFSARTVTLKKANVSKDIMVLFARKDGYVQATKKGRPLFDIVKGKIRGGVKTIGSVDWDANTVTIRGKVFEVSMTPSKERVSVGDGWRVEVREAGKLIVEGQAMGFCMQGSKNDGGTPDEQRADIRQRVAYYLAWRDASTKQ